MSPTPNPSIERTHNGGAHLLVSPPPETPVCAAHIKRWVAADARAMSRIGLISDTHGLLRPEARAFLQGSDYIVHGGDIGRQGILEELITLAPVTAVRGNNDKGEWAESLRESEFL